MDRRPTLYSHPRPERLPLGVGCDSTSSSYPYPIQRQHFTGYGSSATSKTTCNLRGTTSTLPPVSYFRSPQTHGRTASNHQPQTPQRIHHCQTLYHDKSRNTPQNSENTILGHQVRLEGCIPSCFDPSQSTEIPSIHALSQTFLLPGPTVRSERSSRGLHPHSQLATPFVEGKRNKRFSLSRRLVNLGRLSTTNSSRHINNSEITRDAGLHYKLQKVRAPTNPTNHLVGGRVASGDRQVGCVRKAQKRSTAFGPQDLRKSHHHPQKLGIISGFPKFHASNTSTVATQSSQALPTTLDRTQRAQRRETPCPRLLTCRNKVVAARESLPGRSTIPIQSTANFHLDRCFFRRMGRSLRSSSILPGTLVRTRKPSTCQHPRNFGSYKINHRPRSSTSVRDTVHRQRSCTIHNQQVTGQEFPVTSATPTARRSETRTQSDDSGTPHSISPQRSGGCPQPLCPNPNGVGNSVGGICQITRLARPSSSRPHGHSRKRQTTHVCIPSSTSRGNSGRRLSGRLEPLDTDLSVPSTQTHVGPTPQVQSISSPRCDNPSVGPQIALVSRNPPTESQSPTYTRTPNTTDSGRNNPTPLQNLRSLDRLQFLALYYGDRYNIRISDQLSKENRASTIKQQNVAWRHLQEWIPVNVDRLTETHIMEFLMDMRDRFSSATVKNYKSSLRDPLKYGFSIDTNNEFFHKLSRSFNTAEPIIRNRMPDWDLNRIVNSLQSEAWRLDSLSTKLLFRKTIFLVGLAAGNRVSELARARRDPIPGGFEWVRICVPTPFKNERRSHPPPPIEFPKHPTITELCPVRHLRKYIDMTSNCTHRGYLFVSDKGTPLAPGYLASYITDAIRRLDGIATGSSHQIRKMGHSIAWMRGVPVEEIMRNGYWHSPNVFINTYLLPNAPNVPLVAGRSAPM